MSTMQKIFVWILILIGMFILSNFLINVGINSTYKNIQRQDENAQIVVYQADATYVNGRIRGVVKNSKEIQGKYLKIELYSKRNILMGKNYIEVKENQTDGTQGFEMFFKAKDVKSYKIDVVNEKEPGTQIEILPREWTKPEIIFATALMFLIFW